MSIADELIARTERRDLTFGIVGLGYVGLPLALELARAGYAILGYDVNAGVVEGVNAGRSHVKDVTDAQLAEVRGAASICARAAATTSCFPRSASGARAGSRSTDRYRAAASFKRPSEAARPTNARWRSGSDQ